MKMQDNELDELFRSSLNDLEIKPSPNVWDGIGAGLEKGRRTQGYIALLSIAASTVILFMLGYLFIPQKSTLNSNTASQNGLVKTLTPVNKNILSQQPAQYSQLTNMSKPTPRVYANNRDKLITSNKAPGSAIRTGNEVEKGSEQLPPMNTNTTGLITSELPDKNIQIADIQPVQIKTHLTVELPKIIAALPAMNEKTPPVKPKHPALSLGGIINAMVAKVDKRQDKIIEFTDDDGESSITGVNLGIIKIKKDQQTTEK